MDMSSALPNVATVNRNPRKVPSMEEVVWTFVCTGGSYTFAIDRQTAAGAFQGAPCDAVIRGARLLTSPRQGVDASPTTPGQEIHDYLRMEDVVRESGISRNTIMTALQVGKLHGAQNKKRGTWRVERGCMEAWMRGEDCEHRR